MNQLQKLLTDLQNRSRNAISGRPIWQLYVAGAGALVLFVVIYLTWCKLSPKPEPQKNFAPAVAAKPVANLEKKAVAGPKQNHVYDKKQAGKKLDIPAAEAADDDEEIIEAIDTRPGPKASGTRVVTFLNMSTGKTHSVVKDIPRPWASFERGNELAIGYGYSTGGPTYTVRYRREVGRIGSVYVATEIEGVHSERHDPEVKASVTATYKW